MHAANSYSAESDPAALRRELAELIERRRLTDELACALAHYRSLLLDDGDSLTERIRTLRIKVRIAEWRRTCGRVPAHLETIAQSAA